MWTKEEFNILKENYSSILCIEDLMAMLPGRTYNSIINKARKNGFRRKNLDSRSRRKYFFDYDYFQDIDTPNKAYYLGWFYTDGNICKNQCRIRLNKIDEEILDKLIKEVNANYYLYDRDKGKCKEIVLSHKKMADDLKRHGCVEHKTFDLKFPTINDKYLWDFIKGVFDGDGSYICTDKTHKITLCSGSKDFIYTLKDILIASEIRCNITISEKYYILEIGGRISINNFLNKVMNTKSYFLTRKKQKMVKLKTYTNC